jgi:high-affinity iron transporter
VNWADAVPNLLIGLREGLEAGLVVTILLAALRRVVPQSADEAADGASAGGGEGAVSLAKRISSAPVWLGVVGAVALAGSFAAVLTFSTSALSSSAQEAVGGLLSVFAVLLVTGMIFWMRKTARTLSKHLRGEVERAAKIGAGALTLTAFLAVGREGLETTLFLWTAAKASGQTVAPLVGAAIGIAAAVILCALLYRQAVRLNIGTFFNRTAIILIVIAAGVLAYGLGDLQDANLLPGQQWIAFDLTAHIDPSSWWASIITGVTELSPKMTVLQVTAWLAYLIVVIPAFLRPAKPAPAPAAPARPAKEERRAGERWERLAGNRPWTVGGVLAGVPVIVAGVLIAALPTASSAAATSVMVTKTTCAQGWTSASAGAQTFTVTNQSSLAGEINLANDGGAVVGEIETIGPGTTAALTATLSPGTYTFKCYMGSAPVTASQPVTVTGAAPDSPAPVAVKPVTLAELTPPNNDYQKYAAAQLAALATAVAGIQSDLEHNNIQSAKRQWLDAQLDWERVGASYDSFGDLGLAVDGLPDAYQGGVNDPQFTGLHRLEYGLWHGQGQAELEKVTAALAKNVATVRKNLNSDDLAGDPTNLPIRAHEIVEDALRDHLSGMDDEGAGAAFAMTAADVQVDRAVLSSLAALINARQPGLLSTVESQLNTLQQALDATDVHGQWESLQSAPLLARQHVDAAIGAALESLSAVPDLLEVPPAH